MKFSQFMNVAPSATLAMNTLALDKRAKGERVYNLSAGEPMMPSHPKILAGAKQAMEAGKTLYPPVAGIMDLRQAATAWMNGMYASQYKTPNSLVTCGGKFGLFSICQALLNPGDEVVIVAPYWVSYPSMVELFGGVPKIVTTSEQSDWKVAPEALDNVCSAKTKLLIINNAANPTGVLYSREEIKKILSVANQNNVLVVSDEVYSGLTYDNNTFVSVASFPEYTHNVVVVQSVSKHFAMTGWRVGFVFGPEELIQKLAMLQSQSTTGTSSISQWAACAALENAPEIIASVKSTMTKRRDVLVKTFNTLFQTPIVAPQAGLYAFIALRSLGVAGESSVDFCLRALSDAGVAMVPGSAFGAEGYVRLSFGEKEEELIQALTKLKEFCK